MNILNRKHGSRECPAFGKKCKCGRLNHFEIACRVKGIKEIEDTEEEDNLEIDSVKVVKERYIK